VLDLYQIQFFFVSFPTLHLLNPSVCYQVTDHHKVVVSPTLSLDSSSVIMGLGFHSSYLNIQYNVTHTPIRSKAIIIFIDQTTSLNLFVSSHQTFHYETNLPHLADLQNPFDDELNRGLQCSTHSEKNLSGLC
jgi:hypothetical protein